MDLKLKRRCCLALSAALAGTGLAPTRLFANGDEHPTAVPREGEHLPDLPRAAPHEVETFVLKASRTTHQIGPAQVGPTDLWSYNNSVSGPEIRARKGQRLRIRLDNDLDQPTTLHWHGIRIANAMDGAAGLTQEPVPPGESFLYDFIVPDAGTFWYHPHFRSWEQVARGLSGPLIVEDPEPVAVDRDLVLLLDDWRLTETGALDQASLGNGHDWSHAGRLGNWPTVNGRPQPDLPVQHHERLRLRLINAANATIFTLRTEGLSGHVAARDGMACPLEEIMDDLVLAPAQRLDLMVDVTTDEQAILRLTGRENFVLARFPVIGRRRDARLDPPAALPMPDLPDVLSDKPSRSVSLTMDGGAMRWLEEAVVGQPHDAAAERPTPGTVLSGTDLARHKLYWSFNNIAGMPVEPLFQARRGEHIELHLDNRTAFPHVMHWHGHHAWHRLSGSWRDSLLVQPGKIETVILPASNPGDWMLHCHMLEHQAAGMGTWFTVS